MTFLDFLKDNIVILDGGMGTLLIENGMAIGEYPERQNLEHPEIVCSIHKAYLDAGSNVICTNTFGANILKFPLDELREIISAAVTNVRAAINLCNTVGEKFIALDIGPTGKMLYPYGDLYFEDAVEVFAQVVRIGVECGVDLIYIETMQDSYETKAAVLAAKENCSLPVVVTNAYGADGKTLTGASPAAMVTLLEGLGVDALGANCSLGPKQLNDVINELLSNASVPVVFKPNAGLPVCVNGTTIYDVAPEEFANDIAQSVQSGVRLVGGCCGTTPEYISAVYRTINNISPLPVRQKNISAVSSYTHTVVFGNSPVLIGERINPTGKKRFKQALIEHDIGYILNEGISQQEKGVHLLDVNVGLPEINESELLSAAVCELQSVVNLPLQIDTSDVDAMECALRLYNGKPMINSLNGKEESMRAIFPLVKKYGGVVVALTLDENGIPDTADGRIAIARRILNVATEYGINKKNIIFDPLALTVSSSDSAALVTLETIRRLHIQLGVLTSLGISNVSFGLPHRDTINSVFFSVALENGLSAAIINPYSSAIMQAYYAFCVLHGLDENCAHYIAASQRFADTLTPVAHVDAMDSSVDSVLADFIVRGLKEQSARTTAELLKSISPLDIINNDIIPALDKVGSGFENKTVYLPQLLMSAEAAKAAFECIKHVSTVQSVKSKPPFVLCTVEGDIHDIGKNIVKLLLENYGYNVIDLGRDVPCEVVAEAIVKYNAPLVGLSALMTTTVPSMERTIKLIRSASPSCRIIVGGAVLTQEYADKIGADKYAKDAMETVRYAEDITNGLV